MEKHSKSRTNDPAMLQQIIANLEEKFAHSAKEKQSLQNEKEIVYKNLRKIF